jgi:hypothetical protein
VVCADPGSGHHALAGRRLYLQSPRAAHRIAQPRNGRHAAPCQRLRTAACAPDADGQAPPAAAVRQPIGADFLNGVAAKPLGPSRP